MEKHNRTDGITGYILHTFLLLLSHMYQGSCIRDSSLMSTADQYYKSLAVQLYVGSILVATSHFFGCNPPNWTAKHPKMFFKKS